MIGDNLSELGDFSNPKTKGYYFDIDKWIPDTGTIIDPKSYFVTSGDAISKMAILEAHVIAHFKSHYKKCVSLMSKHFNVDRDTAQHMFLSNKMSELDRELYVKSLKFVRTIANIRFLVCKLIDARGRHLLMETDWVDGYVVCYPKNPRGTKFI